MPYADAPTVRSRRVRTVVTIVVILLVAVALNPSKQRHDDALRKKVADRAPLAGLLGLGRLMSWTTSYHSLGVASYTEADDRVVSVGALGLVYVRLLRGE